MHCLLSRSSALLSLLVVGATLWAGCQEPPPGDLQTVDANRGYFGSPDTVKVRLLGWKMPLGSLQFEQLDSTEAAWLRAHNYVLVDWRVDSTATYYYRRQADRRPRWDQRTLMTERLYARRDTQQNRPLQQAEPSGRTWGIGVGSMSNLSSARSLLKTYRRRFATTSLSVHMDSVAAGDTTLYRIIVGSFDSLAVRQALNQYGPQLPADAWPVRRQ